jgi:thiamine biosynthesis lipoprotein
MADGPKARGKVRSAQASCLRLHAKLTRFSPSSELSRLNASEGRPFSCSPALHELLGQSLDLVKLSGGLVTPLVLQAVEQAGYTKSFEQLAQGKSRPKARRPGTVPPNDAVVHSPESRAVILRRGARLDFGGFAKGWAADRLARRLGAFAPATVECGGDLALSGPRAAGEPWFIPVSIPFVRPGGALLQGILERLYVPSGGVATSGRDFRRWKEGGKWRHHVIDPRTGSPAETDVVTATVVAPSALEAEVAAKTCFILGSSAGLRWVERRPELAALVVREDGKVLRSRALKRYLRAVDVRNDRVRLPDL